MFSNQNKQPGSAGTGDWK